MIINRITIRQCKWNARYYRYFVFILAKWSSSDDIVGGKSALDETNLRDGPKIWAPGGADAGDDIDFKPVKFDSNSLKRTQKATVSDIISFGFVQYYPKNIIKSRNKSCRTISLFIS